MSLRGTREKAWRTFRGYAPDVDATELPDGIASDARNVDFDGETVAVRPGKSRWNAVSIFAQHVLALAAHYAQSGKRTVCVRASDGHFYADDVTDGTFVDVDSGYDMNNPGDLWQVRDDLYLSDGTNVPKRRRGGAGTPLSTAMLTAPTGVSVEPILGDATGGLGARESFDSAPTSSDGVNLPTALVTDGSQVEGTGHVKITPGGASAQGAYIYRDWYAGPATRDLSSATHVYVWVRGDQDHLQFKVAVRQNGEAANAIDWSLWPVQKVETADEWTLFRVPLDKVLPTDRDASPGWAIRFVSKGKGGSYPAKLEFDQLAAAGAFEPDVYDFYVTYANAGAFRESNYTQFTVDLTDGDLPLLGFDVTFDSTAQASVDGNSLTARVYRKRKNGPFSRPLLVYERDASISPVIALTVRDVLTDDELAAAEANVTAVPENDTYTRLLPLPRIDMPVAATYCSSGRRNWAGNVTISGEDQGPWSLYYSRRNGPEEFSQVTDDTDPESAGFIRIGDRDPIARLVDFDGLLLVFCDRSVWSIEGTSALDFVVRKRANVGLAARNAVWVADRKVYFLSDDGFRVLLPSRGVAGVYETWLLSEPVDSLLRAIPASTLAECALGGDERGKLRLSVAAWNTDPELPDLSGVERELVFDPRTPGALDPRPNPARPGWTQYTNMAHRCYFQLRRSGDDNGELLAGERGAPLTAAAHVFLLNQGTEDPASTPISWLWQSGAVDGGRQSRLAVERVSADMDPAAGESVTLTAVLDRGRATSAQTGSLGSATTGIVPVERRFPASALGRFLQAKISGAHDVAMRLHAVGLAFFRRG